MRSLFVHYVPIVWSFCSLCAHCLFTCFAHYGPIVCSLLVYFLFAMCHLLLTAVLVFICVRSLSPTCCSLCVHSLHFLITICSHVLAFSCWIRRRALGHLTSLFRGCSWRCLHLRDRNCRRHCRRRCRGRLCRGRG